MKSSYSKTSNRALIIDAETLKRLAAEMSTLERPLEIEAKCRDDTTRKFDSLEELLGYRNPVKRGISELSLTRRSTDFESSIHLILRGDGYTTSQVIITGEEDFVIKKSDAIELDIRGAKAWYSCLHRIDPILVICLLPIILLTVVGFMQWFGLFPETKGSTSTNGSDLQPKGWALMAVMALSGFVAAKLRSKVFPLMIFRIGQEEARYAFWDRIRFMLVGSFIIGPAAAIFWGFFS
ncbi:MAG: hypothetical protein EOP06_09165 [Proteobacteria bacterium]|nr:MAG: hypothetical protein EOP06_09165 [Pseudomonadota bacterium]